jgi:hypothetical protein
LLVLTSLSLSQHRFAKISSFTVLHAQIRGGVERLGDWRRRRRCLRSYFESSFHPTADLPGLFPFSSALLPRPSFSLAITGRQGMSRYLACFPRSVLVVSFPLFLSVPSLLPPPCRRSLSPFDRCSSLTPSPSSLFSRPLLRRLCPRQRRLISALTSRRERAISSGREIRLCRRSCTYFLRFPSIPLSCMY